MDKQRVVIVITIVALSLNTATIVQLPFRQRDARLMGTWQSDVERTIASIREIKPLEDKQIAAMQDFYGKLRVTYDQWRYNSDFKGPLDSGRYEVLGRDNCSVVIRLSADKPSKLEEILETSSFSVIHFEGPDCYWIQPELSSFREYFKRIK